MGTLDDSTFHTLFTRRSETIPLTVLLDVRLTLTRRWRRSKFRSIAIGSVTKRRLFMLQVIRMRKIAARMDSIRFLIIQILREDRSVTGRDRGSISAAHL